MPRLRIPQPEHGLSDGALQPAWRGRGADVRVRRIQGQQFMSTPIIRMSPAPNTSMTPLQALHSALCDAENGMQDVLIIAYDADGYLYIRSSKMTCAEALFMANKAMRWAESGGEE